MTIPARRLIDRLSFDGLMDVRTPGGDIDSRVTCVDAMALAIRGVIEAVCHRNGAIRYLRYLRPELVDSISGDDSSGDSSGVYRSHSGAVANTNMGVYREELGDHNGEITSHTYSFEMLRHIHDSHALRIP